MQNQNERLEAIPATMLKGALAGMCAIGLAAGIAAPQSPAFASTANTEVMIAADDNQISITAPLRVDMVVTADGTFIAPDAASTRIENKSIFGVHVAAVEITPAKGHTITTEEGFTAAHDPNSLWMAIQPNGKTAIQAGDHLAKTAPAISADWNMTKASGVSPSIELAFSGAMKNIDNPTTQATKAYDITWTFAVGNK